MRRSIMLPFIAAAALFLGFAVLPLAAHAQDDGSFLVRPPIHILTPPGAYPAGPGPTWETPGSIACVYKLVKQTKGCPIATSTALPTGGVGAIALVDAFDNPKAANDIKTFADHFGIKYKFFKVVFATGHRPRNDPGGWSVEEALDIEMAAAMAPNANIYLVEAASANNKDMYFAEQVAAKLVAKAGGGVISNSWQGGEYAGELNDEKTYFSHPNIVYFASSGDGGYNSTGFPAVFANVVACRRHPD